MVAAVPAVARRQRWQRARGGAAGSAVLRSLCCVVGLNVAWWGVQVAWTGPSHGSSTTSPETLPKVAPQRRSALLLSTVAAGSVALADTRPALARGIGFEKIDVKGNAQVGLRPYVFDKPEGFRQYASPVDPSGFIFRNTNDSYYSFISRAETKPNASTDFTPAQFIADYREKFTNATGSEFTLISGGGEPFRVDNELGIKYYQIEYVVRTQLGFAFDSLRSLHFLTVFAAAPESIYILNCQDQDDNWLAHEKVLRGVAKSFAVTGIVERLVRTFGDEPVPLSQLCKRLHRPRQLVSDFES